MPPRLIRVVTIYDDADAVSPRAYALDDCGRIWVRETRGYPLAWVEMPRPPGSGAKKDPYHAVNIRRQVCDLFVWDSDRAPSIGALDKMGKIWVHRCTVEGDMWDEVDGPDFGTES